MKGRISGEVCELLHTENHHYFNGNNKGALYQYAGERDPSLGCWSHIEALLWAMSWGHGAVQRALLAELQKQRQAIDTTALLRIICDGDDPTYSQGQSGRRALWALAREGAVTAQRSSAGVLFWQIAHKKPH